MTDRARIEDWLAQGGLPQSDAERRLLRRIPDLTQLVDGRVTDPIDRALLGLSEPSCDVEGLANKLRMGIAGAQFPNQELATMELTAKESGDPSLWVLAARLHAESNPSREAQARMALSEQALPYVFPGELHPMMVDLFAIGERVIPALHVDWIRKITTWMGGALSLDCKMLGLWFWPVLQCLDGKKLARPLNRLFSRTMPEGAKGLAAAYAWRLGLDLPENTAEFAEKDALILALVRLGDQVQPT